MSDILRQSEENGHRLQTLESRPGQIAHRSGAAHCDARAAGQRRGRSRGPCRHADRRSRPTLSRQRRRTTKPKPARPTTRRQAGCRRPSPPTDPGEDAYSAGFHLWEAGQYDQAIASLRAFTAAYPKHRRVSYAKNLIGRALLDKGDARGAAETLLANYRSNPKGERAPTACIILARR